MNEGSVANIPNSNGQGIVFEKRGLFPYYIRAIISFLIGRFACFRKAQMATVSKKDLVNQIADNTQAKRIMVKRVIQAFLDEIINELSKDNRLEFRDFGVFETRTRAARTAQNPKTLEPVEVPAKRTVKFKAGRLLRQGLERCVSKNTPVKRK